MLARHPLAEPTFHRSREPQPRPFRNTNLALSVAQEGLFQAVLLQNNCTWRGVASRPRRAILTR
jgi:hypothetical protein